MLGYIQYYVIYFVTQIVPALAVAFLFLIVTIGNYSENAPSHHV